MSQDDSEYILGTETNEMQNLIGLISEQEARQDQNHTFDATSSSQHTQLTYSGPRMAYKNAQVPQNSKPSDSLLYRNLFDKNGDARSDARVSTFSGLPIKMGKGKGKPVKVKLPKVEEKPQKSIRSSYRSERNDPHGKSQRSSKAYLPKHPSVEPRDYHNK